MSQQNLSHPSHIAALIDHTLLKPTATHQAIEKLCAEADQHGFFSVCIPPSYVELGARLLLASKVEVCTVIGFPLGANTTATKVFEAKSAIAEGATELDMVLNLGLVKAGNWSAVSDEIRAVVLVAGSIPVKVILETCELTREEIITGCEAAQGAGAAFVKTSTGFGRAGADVEIVKLMKQTVGDSMQVKASGGIRSLADLESMVSAGADRIGASSGVAILAALT